MPDRSCSSKSINRTNGSIGPCHEARADSGSVDGKSGVNELSANRIGTSASSLSPASLKPVAFPPNCSRPPFQSPRMEPLSLGNFRPAGEFCCRSAMFKLSLPDGSMREPLSCRFPARVPTSPAPGWSRSSSDRGI